MSLTTRQPYRAVFASRRSTRFFCHCCVIPPPLLSICFCSQSVYKARLCFCSFLRGFSHSRVFHSFSTLIPDLVLDLLDFMPVGHQCLVLSNIIHTFSVPFLFSRH
ncbi:hypothetical protein BO99DRAFT_198703 [Aspergillus violaceofuscus CBS 115571]|uniref:Uncharacterized protein n=1 Tax=Aspergillus violaceofuscus (strain CBS 115571) TaxID=1450538 RepID=A0A2V5HMG8_ASPV1|nr:hypothetical protein BO99DRAFT_198703 [Aspergillus violaceofuscus CBS 115571]